MATAGAHRALGSTAILLPDAPDVVHACALAPASFRSTELSPMRRPEESESALALAACDMTASLPHLRRTSATSASRIAATTKEMRDLWP